MFAVAPHQLRWPSATWAILRQQ